MLILFRLHPFFNLNWTISLDPDRSQVCFVCFFSHPPDKVDDSLSGSRTDGLIIDHDDLIAGQQLPLWRTTYTHIKQEWITSQWGWMDNAKAGQQTGHLSGGGKWQGWVHLISAAINCSMLKYTHFNSSSAVCLEFSNHWLLTSQITADRKLQVAVGQLK